MIRSLLFGWMFLVAWMGFTSCNQASHQEVASVDSMQEHLINANRIMVKSESNQIDEFITRHAWKMTTSGTGLRYEIVHPGTGKKAEANSKVSVSFSVSLLDGTLCDSSSLKNPLTFILGRGEQARGLEEGILLMREGDQARLVVPAHLGFGKLGDDKKIPGNSALYYDVTLINVINTQ